MVIGLGNPGDKYVGTRHNLGFMVLDEYAKKHLGPEIIWQQEKKFKAETLKLPDNILLVKPQTFMNNSGLAISLIANFFKVQPEDLIVIHDDLDLKLGKIKVRMGGAAAGHHGVESVLNIFKTDKFIRLRLGIGNMNSHISAEKFVVEPFMSNEKSSLKKLLKQSILALDLLLKDGLEKAQNQFN